MQIAHFSQVAEVAPIAKGFRGGGIRFKDLLVGVEGAPDNFGLQWVTVDEAFHTPQHRHNFEQVRIMMEGSFGFGPTQVQHAGSVGYFCEGTYYTQNAKGRSVTLLLQVGGPSGSGFMSRRQLRGATEALLQKGSFQDGVFTWLDASGKKHNQDSFEASWELVNQRKIVYTKPQFDGPILMEPERFAWIASKGTDGVSERHLGSFNERGLSITQIKLEERASHRVQALGQGLLLFCMEGQGKFSQHAKESEAFERWVSVHLLADEELTIEASRSCIFWCLHLPRFT